MEQKKINIAELLKDCPKGMELDCTMYDGCIFNRLVEYEHLYPIKVQTPDGQISLNKYGCYSCSEHAKCIIFPKGKTTWEGFVPPYKFKEGDVIYIDNFVAILSNITDRGSVWYHCYYCIDTEMFKAKRDFGIGNINCDEFRFATEEEKKKLFQAIEANGCKWNAETKTLEKLVEPKFKVGDMIQDVDKYKVKITEVNLEDECYGYESMIAKGIGGIPFKEQNNWGLVPNKFDITTLKPFESRVLTRDNNSQKWFPAIWGYYDFDSHGYPHKLIGGVATRYCIPYESNEHLLGTTDDCDEYYKTW